MAKSRGRRDLFTPKPLSIARPVGLPALSSRPVNLSLFEDRRVFHPLGPARPVFSLPKSAAVVRVPGPPRTRTNLNGAKARTPKLYQLQFSVPTKVALCVRRKRRKEILHAKGVAGSKKRMRSPRRNYWSSISCK